MDIDYKENTENEDGCEKASKKYRKKLDSKLWKGFFAGIAVTIAAFAVIFLCYMYLPINIKVSSPEGIAAYKKISEVVGLIDKYYIGETDSQILADNMFLGLLSGLGDKYSTYYTEEEYEEISTAQSGQYAGIGITIISDSVSGDIEIVDVTKDGPADKAGILVGDIIRQVNGMNINGMTSSNVSELIQNAESDDIVMLIYRADTDEEFEITVTRQLLESVVVWGGVLSDTNIGYIAINSFKGVTSEQFRNVIEQLTDEETDALIIDIRQNTGGLVSAACDTLSQLIPEGVLVYTEDKNGNRDERISDSGEEIDLPIAVLVDEQTASASEIFAGALQDYGVAAIVGTQTFGKGIIQDVFRLSDGSVIRLTVSYYFTPNGNNIHGVGITPDIEAEYDENAETDTQLLAAIEFLTK